MFLDLFTADDDVFDVQKDLSLYDYYEQEPYEKNRSAVSSPRSDDRPPTPSPNPTSDNAIVDLNSEGNNSNASNDSNHSSTSSSITVRGSTKGKGQRVRYEGFSALQPRPDADRAFFHPEPAIDYGRTIV